MNKPNTKDLSTISSFQCVLEHVYWVFIVFICYNNIIFVSLDGMSASKSKLILIICMVISSVIGTVIRWNKYMTTRAVFADVMIGIGIYTILAYRKYYPKWIGTIIAVLVLLCALYTVLIFIRKYKGIAISKISNIRKKRFVIKNRLLKAFNGTSLAAGVMLTVLLVPITYNRIFNGGILVANAVVREAAEGFDKDYTENEFSLTANIDVISKIRTPETWEPLSADEKLEVLQRICDCEANYFGIETPVAVVMNELDEHILGEYNNFERRITINRIHLENCKPEEILNTILHEYYHHWQYTLINLWLNASESDKKLRVFEHCEEYLNELANYQDERDSFEEYVRYYTQYLERDARQYAAQTVKEYYDEIDLILEEQSSNSVNEEKEGVSN